MRTHIQTGPKGLLRSEPQLRKNLNLQSIADNRNLERQVNMN